ncbi:MAG: hypothetical protein M3Z41_07025 [Candidatus Eremiobacteraeota bacterium]|nr:hypothetical protein [Candidatus Eremiobacteraeota bacterium]
MASVNLTCPACDPADPCQRCRSIARALRAAGHSITQSSRYDALRAATVGAYGFDACVLPIANDERAIVDGAAVVLSRARVALVLEPGALAQLFIPKDFVVVESVDWQHHPFPTQWVSNVVAAPQADDTRVFEELSVPPATDVDAARRRLKGVARRAQRDVAAAGFPGEGRLDLLATLEDEIAWAKMSGSCFGLVLVHVRRKAGSTKAEHSERSLAVVRQHIEPVVRSSDVISQGSDSLLVIVGEAALDQTDTATSRIKKAIRKALKTAEDEKRMAQEVGRVTLGTAVYPTHGTTRAALLARATASGSTV